LDDLTVDAEVCTVNSHEAVYFPALKHTVILANITREYDEYGVEWMADYQTESGDQLPEHLADLYDDLLREILQENEDHF
jgi:Mn-containing catalase